MKLEGINRFLSVLKCRGRAAVGLCDDLEIPRQISDAVLVAHPDLGWKINSFPEGRRMRLLQMRLTEFSAAGVFNRTSKMECRQLMTITQTKDRKLEFQQF